ncbi:MAG: hypothetical protein CMB08_07070 [Euryarchaeota archaeon]|nr:hypothetical protein [Euryarchaeota archaeon]|tara:strand:- start:190 stop:549 length:360 start_codon:yes stop_codon:yes gene_type:complete
MDILDPQIWLVLVGLIHAVVGVILPGVWSDDTYKMTGGFMLLTTVTMLYTAFMMDGEEQARMALVIAGPIWVWFVIVCAQGLTWTVGEKSIHMTWKENAPPLVLWGICALSGLLGSGWI